MRGYDAIQTGVIFTAATLGILASSLAAERLAKRRPQRTLIAGGFVTTIVGVGVLLALVALVSLAAGWLLAPAESARLPGPESLGTPAPRTIRADQDYDIEDSEATAISLYDGTVEGFDFPDLNARSVQFHPEAGPGPHDGWPLLETWIETLAEKS